MKAQLEDNTKPRSQEQRDIQDMLQHASFAKRYIKRREALAEFLETSVPAKQFSMRVISVPYRDKYGHSRFKGCIGGWLTQMAPKAFRRYVCKDTNRKKLNRPIDEYVSSDALRFTGDYLGIQGLGRYLTDTHARHKTPTKAAAFIRKYLLRKDSL
jgi:hypothetical protein